MAMNLDGLGHHRPATGLLISFLFASMVNQGAAFSAVLPVDARGAHGPLLLLGGRCSASLGVPNGRVSLSRRSMREGSLVAARMAEDNGKKDDGEEDKGLMGKIKGYFSSNEDGSPGQAETNLNYVVDLVTLSAGAAVFTCLFLNLMGKVPCI